MYFDRNPAQIVISDLYFIITMVCTVPKEIACGFKGNQRGIEMQKRGIWKF